LSAALVDTTHDISLPMWQQGAGGYYLGGVHPRRVSSRTRKGASTAARSAPEFARATDRLRTFAYRRQRSWIPFCVPVRSVIHGERTGVDAWLKK
jgi:hypothetical protein